MRTIVQVLGNVGWAGLMVFAALPAMGQVAGSCARCAQVQHEPYKAEFKITHVQTLADGTTITRETKEISALDSQGRRMNANSIVTPGAVGQAEILRTSVHDPVENTEASWDTQSKSVRVTKLPPEDQRHGCWVNDAGNYRANYGPVRLPDQPAGGGGGAVSFGTAGTVGSGFAASMPVAAPGVMPSVPPVPVSRPAMNRPVRDDLGTDVIQGVEARGSRITQTIPVGQIGNDRPIVSTQETWMAPSLGGVVLRSVNDSPQTGKMIREVVSLSLGDPDPSAFQPPEGYKVTVDVLHEVACQQGPQ